MLIKREPHHIRIEIHPAVHLIPADVSHHMVHVQQPNRTRKFVFFHRAISRHKDAFVLTALYKGMDSIAIGGNCGKPYDAMLIAQLKRLANAPRAALCRLLPCIFRIIYPQRDVVYTIPMPMHMLSDLTVRPKRSRKHKTNLALLQNIRSAVTNTGFRPGISNEPHSESEPVIIGSLPRIVNIIGPVEREKIFLRLHFRMRKSGHRSYSIE